MKVLSYNCRGRGSSAKKDELRELIRKEKCEVAFIQETKIDAVDDNFPQALSGNSEFKGVAQFSQGRAGGLMILWNSTAVSVRSSWDFEGGLVFNGFCSDKGVDVCLVNVYGPCDRRGRAILWDLIYNITECYGDGCICIGGDFNEVRIDSERRGKGRFEGWVRRGAEEFDDLIHKTELVDLPLQGRTLRTTNQTGLAEVGLIGFL